MFDLAITESAVQWSVPPELIRAIITVESNWNPAAYNPNDPGGAWGLMQMLPATAQGLGYFGSMEALLTDTTLAIDLGTHLLHENLVRTGGDVAWAVSAYNGGWQTRNADGTFTNQLYVNRVLGLMGGGSIAGGGAGVMLAGFRRPGPGGRDHPETAGLSDAATE